MRKSQTFAKKITEWELLNANIQPHLAEMPHLQEIVTAIEALIAEAKVLDGEQEVARGRLQDIVHRRQDVEKRGETLRRRVAAHLKGSFGFSSDELVKFGVRPRPTGPRKRKTPATTPPTPAPEG
ncbi:MAG TPA: hypothetical protein VGX68_05825 [Thermoanaerobaculia bacterium]|jgi:hypothetical protein|nr:hypothetical protein [Thermoanaerobaculia bacterium]